MTSEPESQGAGCEPAGGWFAHSHGALSALCWAISFNHASWCLGAQTSSAGTSFPSLGEQSMRAPIAPRGAGMAGHLRAGSLCFESHCAEQTDHECLLLRQICGQSLTKSNSPAATKQLPGRAKAPWALGLHAAWGSRPFQGKASGR